MMQLTLWGGLFFCRLGTLVVNGSWWQQASNGLCLRTPGSSNRQDMRLWTVESGFESLPRNSQLSV
jgi:hypothetical protein